MQQFQITLKNEKRKYYNQIAWLVIILTAIYLLYLYFFSGKKELQVNSIVTLVIIILFILLKLYFNKTKYNFSFYPLFFLLSVLFLNSHQYWFTGVFVLISLLYPAAIKDLNILVSKSRILYPGFFYRRIKWEKLSNVILKDGLLTIDFKNNKIIQQQVDEEKTMVDEKDFNEFCRQQLTQ
jgi:hypothetical protein